MLDISILKRNNFNPNEFTDSVLARTEGIDNSIYDPDVLANMNRTADKAQEIRDLLAKPIKITSGYRCLKLNRELGSKDTSQHIKGQAIDFVCPSFGTPEEILYFLKENNVVVDQCLMEGSWIHLSIREEGGNRNQLARYELGPGGRRILKEI